MKTVTLEQIAIEKLIKNQLQIFEIFEASARSGCIRYIPYDMDERVADLKALLSDIKEAGDSR